jgi:hypothetical protein
VEETLAGDVADILALNKASRIVLEALTNGPSLRGTTGIEPTGFEIGRSTFFPGFLAIYNKINPAIRNSRIMISKGLYP